MEGVDTWLRPGLDRLTSVLPSAEEGRDELDMAGSNEGANSGGSLHDESLASTMTRQKVAATKKYIENHYKAHMKSLQERRER